MLLAKPRTATPLALGAILALGCGAPDASGPNEQTAGQLEHPLTAVVMATSSSNENANYGPALAVDGNFATRWSSAFSDPQWLQLDFGARQGLSRVVLSWEAAYSRAYDVQVSDDAVSWQTLATQSNGDGGKDDIALSGAGRFLRIYCRTRATQWGNSLWEVEAYGPDPVQPPTQQLLTRPNSATASSLEVSTLGANLAVDGNAQTRWSSQYADPQWISQDLGSVARVTEVQLSWEAAYGRDYSIQGSKDGSTWTTIKSVTGADGGSDVHTGLSADARYVRVYGTQRGTAWGYSLWELRVYGTTSTTTPECVSSADCNDNNGCTNDVCSGGACSHPDNGTCSAPAIDEPFKSLSQWDTAVRSPGGSASIISDAAADDGSALQLKLPGNAGLGPNDNAGPGFASEVIVKGPQLYGTYETRVRLSSCSAAEEVVDGIFTYFNDGSDQNGNGITDNSEIDIEYLCGTPSILWLTVYTDFSDFAPGKLRKLSRKVDMRTGRYETYVDWPPTTSEQGTIAGLAMPNFPGNDWYTLGFDWRADRVSYYVLVNGTKLELFRITDASRIPRRTSSFLMNIWHANAHWTDGAAADYPAGDASMVVDWAKIWR